VTLKKDNRYRRVEPCSCGSSDLELAEAVFQQEVVSMVSCKTCAASGPPRDTREAAVLGWNLRQRHKQKAASNTNQEKKSYVH
jgi:hypothetical protein